MHLMAFRLIISEIDGLYLYTSLTKIQPWEGVFCDIYAEVWSRNYSVTRTLDEQTCTK